MTKNGTPSQVAHADEVGAVLDERDELLAVGLGALAVGDVDAGRGQEQDPARLVPDRQDRDVDDPLAAVGDEVGHLARNALPAAAWADAALIRSTSAGDGAHHGPSQNGLPTICSLRVAAALPGQPVRLEDGAVQVHDPGEQRPCSKNARNLAFAAAASASSCALALLGLPLPR